MSSAHHHSQEAPEPTGNFDINKIADHLSVHRSTVERLLHAGEFGRDWWRIGRKYVVPKKMYLSTRGAKEKSGWEVLQRNT
jgi:excisionase family DNA binding protein